MKVEQNENQIHKNLRIDKLVDKSIWTSHCLSLSTSRHLWSEGQEPNIDFWRQIGDGSYM